MQVAIDEQIFLLQRRGGISRQFAELIRCYDNNPALGVRVQLPFTHVSNETLGVISDRPVHSHEGRWRRRALLEWAHRRPVRSSRPDRSNHTDLVHHTFFDPAFLRDFPGVPKVVTIFDMIPERQPQSVPPGVHLGKDKYIDQADLVITQTEVGRQDLLEFYPNVRGQVVVIPLGVDDVFFDRPEAQQNEFTEQAATNPYLLFVGERSGYKDFYTLLLAFQQLSKQFSDLRLLAVGGRRFSHGETVQIERLGLSDRVTQRTLSNTDLPRAYANATAFVMPSRYEGFGLPILEAFAAGAPVVLSDSSCLTEVGANTAHYFPVGDHAALVEVLRKVIAGGDDVDHLVALGRQRARLFTWRDTAAKTADAYRLVL